MEQNEYTLNEMLEMMYYYGVDVQVCWECWISRYGLPTAVDDPSNPKYGGLEDGDDLMDFPGQEKKAIQDMFNSADKVIDFD